jgi:hypothetical protein
MNYKRVSNLSGWLVFAIATVVYFFSVERTGSLWDCGEFISGAYKLQVVHPPGAPLFLMIGRVFTLFAELFSDNPEDIAFSVNMLSGISSAFAAAFVAWITIMLGRFSLVGRDGETDGAQNLALGAAGLVAGLATAFSTSIWFSAVEGEVYALSTFFTAMTLWATIKWYVRPNTVEADRWLVFAVYAAGLSTGVHLLSILTFPALALFYYFKKYERHSLLGMGIAAAAGVLSIVLAQSLIITGIPNLWKFWDIFLVNSLGLPPHSGLVPTLAMVAAVLYFGLRYAHKRNSPSLQLVVVSAGMLAIGFSTIGMVVIRANANPPINMNDPSDVTRLVPYINREQYGERPLLFGPYYDATPSDNEFEPRYGLVGDRYEIVDEKVSYTYRNADKMLFPRMGDNTQNRSGLYQMWRGGSTGKPSQLENLAFMVRYQMGWMYWRYFMWNFAGRQNGEQGFYAWDPKSGNWYTGIKFLDEARLFREDYMPDTMRNHKARNRYFMLPLLFGVFGLFFHFARRKNEAMGLLAMFIITGLGIIIYSNQPPNEPRERDYVLVGSFFTFSIWIGMGVLALFSLLKERARLSPGIAAALAGVLVLSAPLIMGFENYDDHSRMHHKASRDYATNFLNSCAPNSIIFTYGDNDTYPLWYAQEVEKIRTDVRVVNLSLIAVDWYIDQMRRKVNDSPPIKFTIPSEAYRGSNRNAVPYYNTRQSGEYNPNLDSELNALDVLDFVGADQGTPSSRRQARSFLPTKRMYLQVDSMATVRMGAVSEADTGRVTKRIPIQIDRSKNYLIKDELAVLDIIASNINERPIYFAVTTRPEKMFGLQDYMQLEGLGLRLVPVFTPLVRERQQYGQVYGAGRVAADIMYENVMNSFVWGNFDKKDLYVDRSYGPSIQSHNLTMIRLAEDLLLRGDKERALDVCLKYLEAFPHMNFAYDYRTMRIFELMIEADGYEQAKPHMQILAEETRQYLDFFMSISDQALENGFQQDLQLSIRAKDDLLRAVKRAGDAEFEAELREMFAAFQPRPQESPLPQ